MVNYEGYVDVERMRIEVRINLDEHKIQDIRSFYQHKFRKQ